MTANLICSQCAQPLLGDAPQSLCPQCLLAAALASQSALASHQEHTSDPSSSEAIAPEAGVRLKYFGDYELLEEIARGGMGIVWKARQTSLKREVALKMVRAGALATPQEVARFLREAEAAANLQHPHIVAIHEVGEYGGQHYFSMDYVAGRNLAALIKDGPLPPQGAARYVQIIAEAIQYAHQRGTLHRDLKPQNVLIDAMDQPRITDFGLAKVMTDDSLLTQPGVVMGSPSYMPPEQAEGRVADIGPASDVYALGAMLYELLTGKPPFRAATAMATLREVVQTEPENPQRSNRGIPDDLATICLKCLEKLPQNRYPTARALAEELDRFLKGDPILARPASPVRKAISAVRRHPGRVAALAAFLLVALAIGLYSLIEENAFLRARHADPDLMRTPGVRHEDLKVWQGIHTIGLMAGIYALLFLMAKTRGLTLKDWGDQAQLARPPIQPLGERLRVMTSCFGLALTGFGVMFLAKAIQTSIWEGKSIWFQLLSVYSSVYFGLAILAYAIQDYFRALYGVPSRQLAPDQIESIRQAMENYDLLAAIKVYRKSVPDASFAEANQYAVRLAQANRAEHPGKFVPPALSLTQLNWADMSIGATVVFILLGLYVALFPPSQPAWFAGAFGSSLLLGLSLLACTRVKSFWVRFVWIDFIIVAIVAIERLLGHFGGPSAWSIGPYLAGFCLGVFLMGCAFHPPRRGKA